MIIGKIYALLIIFIVQVNLKKPVKKVKKDANKMIYFSQ